MTAAVHASGLDQTDQDRNDAGVRRRAQMLSRARTEDAPSQPVVKGGSARSGSADALPESRLAGVDLIRMTRVDDPRGGLVAANFDSDLPFVPRRFFTVFGVPTDDVRGAHAHRQCHQLLICVQGNLTAVVDDGHARQEFLLDRPDVGLHMRPMIWGTQYRYSHDAVLLVLASDPYDADDYIRDHDAFLAEVAQQEQSRDS